METCFLLNNGCDDIEGEGCTSEGKGKCDRFACFKTEAEATESPAPSGQAGLPDYVPSTCDYCTLKGRRDDDGHCYMWKNWPDNKKCSEFRRRKDK